MGKKLNAQELAEGLENLRWLQQHGADLIADMLQPTWPQNGGGENGK